MRLIRNSLARQRRGGFTLLELIIVIAIIGLLSALAGPSLSAWIWKARLNEATRNVERKLNTVRKLSLANGTRHCVQFTPDSNYTNGGPDFSIIVTVTAETAPGSEESSASIACGSGVRSYEVASALAEIGVRW